MWHVEIVEGYGADLELALSRVNAEGWTVRYVLPNGINRWTVVCERVG